MTEVMHDEKRMQFLIEVDGYKAHLDYKKVDGGIDIRHTIVPKEIGGRGIAGRLVKAAYDYTVDHGLDFVATCSYAVKWLEKHEECVGKVGGDFGGEGSCAF